MPNQYKYLDAFFDEQRSNGKYSFATEGLHTQLGVSENALKKTLQRLKAQEAVAMVRKGFYVIVPPEYRAKGIIPTSLYVNDLMKFLGRDYYVGLLNAAAFHGAAHQQPQSFSIITKGSSMRPIKNEKVNIAFYTKSQWNEKDVVKKKVDTGYLNVSSPELTALDLVNYFHVIGGFNRAATVLEELKEEIQPSKLEESAREYHDVAAVQRLGYLLQYILEENAQADALFRALGSTGFYPTLLRPQKEKAKSMVTGNKWKIVPNIKIETDQ